MIADEEMNLHQQESYSKLGDPPELIEWNRGSRELACYSRLPSRMKEAILEDPMNSSSSDSLKFIEPQFIEDDKLNSRSH